MSQGRNCLTQQTASLAGQTTGQSAGWPAGLLAVRPSVRPSVRPTTTTTTTTTTTITNLNKVLFLSFLPGIPVLGSHVSPAELVYSVPQICNYVFL